MNYYEKSKEKTVELWYDYVKIGGFCPFAWNRWPRASFDWYFLNKMMKTAAVAKVRIVEKTAFAAAMIGRNKEFPS